MPMWAKVEAKVFFSLLWSAYKKITPTRYCELRYNNNKSFDSKNIRHIWGTITDLPDWASEIGFLNKIPHNVHYGVLPRTKMSGKGNCTEEAGCAWVDIDGIGIDTLKGSVFPRLSAVGLRPSMYVDSGWGFHLFWVFSDVTYLSDMVRNANLVLSLLSNGDSGVASLSHLLRCPGSWNCKASPPRKVVPYVWKGKGFAYEPSIFLNMTNKLWNHYSENFKTDKNKLKSYQVTKGKYKSLRELSKECTLINTALNFPGNLSYIGWISLCAFLCKFYSDGDKVFHCISKKDKVRYDFDDTEKIINSIRGYMPYNSEKIPECKYCKQKCKNIITLGGNYTEKNN